MIIWLKIILSITIVVVILMVVSVIVSVTTKKWQIKNYGYWRTIKDSELFQWCLYWLCAMLLVNSVIGIYFLL